jgi:ATP-dependent DNA helicase
MPAAAPIAPNKSKRSKQETMAEMAASLLKLEGEKINVVPNTAEGKASVISDEDLDMLLDRSPAVFADRGKGWTSTGQVDQKDVVGAVADESARDGKKAAFAVYEAPVDTGNHALAGMLGEAVDVE